MQPAITIITPVLDEDTFIERCVRNVIDQDCSKVEHLIIDLSSSSIAKIAVGDLAQRHENIIYLSKPNTSLSEAMNHGIHIANGMLIGFLQNRSLYGPRTLKRIVKIVEGLKKPSLLVGNCNILSEEGDLIHANQPKHIKYFDVLAGQEYPYYPVSYFYHKSLHNTVGKFNHDDKHLIHFNFLLRLIQSTPVHYYNETWGTSISSETIHSKAKKAIDQQSNHLRKQYIQQLSIAKKLWIRAKKFKNGLRRPENHKK